MKPNVTGRTTTEALLPVNLPTTQPPKGYNETTPTYNCARLMGASRNLFFVGQNFYTRTEVVVAPGRERKPTFQKLNAVETKFALLDAKDIAQHDGNLVELKKAPHGITKMSERKLDETTRALVDKATSKIYFETTLKSGKKTYHEIQIA